MVFRCRSVRPLPLAVLVALLAAAPSVRAQNVEVRGVDAIDFGSIDRQVDGALDDLRDGQSLTIETPTRARVRIQPLAERVNAAGANGNDCRAYRYDYTHADGSATLEIHGIRCRSPGGYWVMLGDEEIVRVRPRSSTGVAASGASAPASASAALVPGGPVGIPKPNPVAAERMAAAAAPVAEPAATAPEPAATAVASAPAEAMPATPETEAAGGGSGRVVYPGGPAPAAIVTGEPDPDVVSGLQLLGYLPPDQPATASAVSQALADFGADEGVTLDVAVLRSRLDEALSRNRMLVSCGRTGPGACLAVR